MSGFFSPPVLMTVRTFFSFIFVLLPSSKKSKSGGGRENDGFKCRRNKSCTFFLPWASSASCSNSFPLHLRVQRKSNSQSVCEHRPYKYVGKRRIYGIDVIIRARTGMQATMGRGREERKISVLSSFSIHIQSAAFIQVSQVSALQY